MLGHLEISMTWHASCGAVLRLRANDVGRISQSSSGRVESTLVDVWISRASLIRFGLAFGAPLSVAWPSGRFGVARCSSAESPRTQPETIKELCRGHLGARGHLSLAWRSSSVVRGPIETISGPRGHAAIARSCEYFPVRLSKETFVGAKPVGAREALVPS